MRQWIGQALAGYASGKVGAVSLTDFDWNLFGLSASARGVHVDTAGFEAHAERVDVRLGAAGRFHLRLSRPQLTLRPRASRPPDATAPQRPWAALERLAGLEIEGGTLRTGADARLVVEGLDARLSRQAETLALVATGRLAALRDATPSILSVDATARVRPGVPLEIERLRVRSNQGSFEARGRIDSLSPLRAALAGELQLDFVMLAQAGLDTGLTGRIAGPLTITDDVLRVVGRAESVHWNEVGPLDGEGVFVLRLDGLALEQVALVGYGGRARLDGQIPFGARSAHLRIAADGLDAAALLRDLTGAELPVASRSQGTVDVRFGGDALATTGGRLQLAAAPELRGLPIAGAVKLQAKGAAWRVDLDALRWPGGGGSGRLQADAAGALTGTAVVDADDLSQFGATLRHVGTDLPETRWLRGHARADVTFSGVPSRPVANGRIVDAALAFAGLEVTLGGGFVLNDDALVLDSVEAQAAAGGHATLSGTLAITSPTRWDLRAQVQGLNLGPVAGADPALSPSLDGHLHIEGDADTPTWTAQAKVPLDSEAGQRLGLVAAGDFDAFTDLELRGEAVPLAPLRALLGLPDDLDGSLAGSLRASGPFATPRGEGQWTATTLRWRGAALPDAAATLSSDGATARFVVRWPDALARAEIALAPGYAMSAEVDLAALPVAELVTAFPRFAAEARVDVQGRAHFAGSLGEPSTLRASVDVGALELSTGGVERRAGPFHLAADHEGLDITGLAFADGLAIDGRVPFAPGAPLALHVRGTPALAWARLAFPTIELDGEASLDVRLSGTGERPRVEGRAEVELRAGRIGALAWDQVALKLAGEGDRLHVESARVALMGGTISATGAVPLPGPPRGAAEQLVVRIEGVDLFARAQPAVASAAAAAPRMRGVVAGQVQVHAANWDLAQLQVDSRMSLDIGREGERLLRSVEPARVRVAAGRAMLESAAFEGPAGRLEVRAAVPLLGRAGDVLDAAVAGPVDLAIFNPLLGAYDLTAAGTADLDLRWRREGRGPLSGTGTIAVRDAQLALQDPPTAFTELQAALRLQGTLLTLESLDSRVGGGTFTARGTIDAAGGRVDLQGAADRVALTAIEGVSAQVSGPLSLTGEGERLKLGGDLEILGGLVSREFDAESESLTMLDWQLRSLRGQSPADRLALDLRLRSSEDLRVRNSLVDVQAGGNLTVRGTLGSYLVDGGFDVRQGGTVWLRTTRTQTQAGRVALSGYPLRPPELDLGLLARVSGIDVEVELGGTTDNMKTSLRAPDRPELNESDLTSLLLTGRVIEQATQESGAIAAEQIAAALGSRLQSQLGDGFELEVASGQDVFSRDDDPNTRVRASRRLNEKTKLSYTVGIDGEDQQWAVEWRPLRYLQLLGLVHDNDAVSLEANHRLTLNLPGRSDVSHETISARVGTVLLAGDAPRPAEEMRRQLKAKPGRTFDAWEARADAERLRVWLGQHGFRSALVEVEERRGESDAGRIDLRFVVRAGPTIRFRWEGDPPGADLVRAVESAWDPYRAPERLPTELANRARHALLATGFPDATVTARSTLVGNAREVVFAVTKGPQVPGLVLEFPGAAAVSEVALRARLPKPGSAAFYALLDDPSQLALTLRLPYAQLGLLDVEVGPAQRPPRAAGAPPRIVIPIVEPAPDRILELRLPPLPAGAAAPVLKQKEGEPFGLAAFEADRATLARHFQEQGHLDARVRARLENAAAGAGLRLIYEVEPGPRLWVGSIRIEAQGRSRDHVVRRLLTFAEGDVLRPSVLAESRRRLGQMPTTRSVDLRLVPSAAGDDHRDVVVDLAERADLELRYGLRWNSGDPDADAGTDAARDPSVEWGAAAVVANPFGRGLRLGGFASFRGDAFDFGARAAAFNAFGWQRITAELFVRDRSEEEEDFDGLTVPTRTRSLTAMASRYFRERRLRLQGSYAFSQEAQQHEAGEQLLYRGSLNLGMIADRRDSFIDPRRGHFASLNAGLFSKSLGSDLGFQRFYGQAFAYVPFGRATWASAVRLGVIPGEQQAFDDDDLFMTGGPSTVRAFELDDLAPVDARGVPGGQALAVFNSELRLKTVGPLQLVAFWDAGNTFVTVSDASWSGLRMDAGVGARIVLSFGVLRLDWAHLLDPEPGESKQRWVFSFGQPF
ncbi:MAG: translocation/assembly module TamB domain-containing protein [Vicinamibacteria bacterium]|nr:translocation/assembly module TamB domain-containing protein [Vicinamibacteria bacterium]